jgi:hypothetical protein
MYGRFRPGHSSLNSRILSLGLSRPKLQYNA